MPFENSHINDIGLETADGPVCVYDVKDGAIKSAEEIFEGGVQFFMGEGTADDRALAESVTRKNMKSLPYWLAHPFDLLNGEEATDEEFGMVMAKLM